MEITQIIEDLIAMAADPFTDQQTADTIKVGSGDARVTKIAVSMFATPEIIKKAAAFGANFLIVHEPLYYNHFDTEMPYSLCSEKKALIEENNLTVFRFHDFAHRMLPDLIFEGQIQYSGLKGRFEKGNYVAVNRFILDEEMTTLELAKRLETSPSEKHLKIAGCRNNKVKTISCCFGTPGHLAQELEECDIVLTGEISEWAMGEYLRDLSEMGYNKSMIVMGHFNSEKCGMMLLAEKLTEMYPNIKTQYFDCGDVYTYTD